MGATLINDFCKEIALLKKAIPRSRGSVDNFSDFPPMMPDLPETLLAEGKFNKVLKTIFMFAS